MTSSFHVIETFYRPDRIEQNCHLVFLGYSLNEHIKGYAESNETKCLTGQDGTEPHYSNGPRWRDEKNR